LDSLRTIANTSCPVPAQRRGDQEREEQDHPDADQDEELRQAQPEADHHDGGLGGPRGEHGPGHPEDEAEDTLSESVVRAEKTRMTRVARIMVRVPRGRRAGDDRRSVSSARAPLMGRRALAPAGRAFLVVTVLASLFSPKGRAQNIVAAARRHATEYLDVEKDCSEREKLFPKLLDEGGTAQELAGEVSSPVSRGGEARGAAAPRARRTRRRGQGCSEPLRRDLQQDRRPVIGSVAR
jgi:hypothetical protein